MELDKRIKEGKKPYTVANYPNGKNQPKQVEQPENKSPKFKNYYENPVYKDNEEALSKLVRKDLSDTIQNILKENEFADLKEFSKYLKENNPAAYKALQKIKEQQWFKSQSVSNKFFGKDGIDHVSNKYFRINHNPDENTVLLEVDRDRIRTVGQDKKYVYILDKNKAIYLKNTLPVLSWNDDTKEQKIHLIAKFNNISDNTVQSVFDTVFYNDAVYKNYLPKAICIDEFIPIFFQFVTYNWYFV